MLEVYVHTFEQYNSLLNTNVQIMLIKIFLLNACLTRFI